MKKVSKEIEKFKNRTFVVFFFSKLYFENCIFLARFCIDSNLFNGILVVIFCKAYKKYKLDKIFKLERKIINTFELDTLTELNAKQNFTTTIIACPFSVQAHANDTVSLLLVGLPEMQS
jgi:hypothetical protein